MGRSKAGMDRPDVFDANCPSRRCLALISDKWSVLVIWALSDGTHRFGDLRRRIRGVSQKMLTQTLRGLERSQLVERTVFAEVPPRVEYKLTPLGQGLTGALSALCEWAERYFAQTRPELLEEKRLSAGAAPGPLPALLALGLARPDPAPLEDPPLHLGPALQLLLAA